MSGELECGSYGPGQRKQAVLAHRQAAKSRLNREESAFSLVELLTVLAILALLLAVSLPVLAMARGKARELTCNSHLRQIGLAIKMYCQDYDDLYPWALDAHDRYNPQIWDRVPEFRDQLGFMPMLPEVLRAYGAPGEVFRCPADSGFTVGDFNGLPLDATPSSYLRFGSSYSYRTEIIVRRFLESSFQTPAQVNLVFDSSGKWHGGILKDLLRYNVLHADGHTKSLNRPQLDRLWAMPL